MRTFTISEIVEYTNGKLLSGKMQGSVCDVSIDSREAKPGDLFFALKGKNNDAHNYLQQVLDGGCRALVISKPEKLPCADDLPEDTNIILVENTTIALQELARHYLNSLDLKTKIAVTGSVGKTSTRDMMYYVASTKYKTGRNLKNFNNGFGLPIAILNFPQDTEVAVLEMGMSAAGEIKKLAELVRPDIAVITNIGVSHIQNLGSREGILNAKMEVTQYFDKNATLVVNETCDLLDRENVSGDYNLITVGEEGKNDYIISNVCDLGDKGIKYTLDRKHKQYEVNLPVPGAHNAVNSTLAVAVGELIGIPVEQAIAGLNKVELTGKRLNVKGKNGIKVIDDTYNACPDSMKSAINTLTSTKGLRKVAVLGDMYELGAESAAAHREIGEFAYEKNIDLLIAVGKDAENYAAAAEPLMGKDRVKYYSEKEDFIKEVPNVIRPGDVVLVKASRGMEMEKIVKKIFEDKE